METQTKPDIRIGRTEMDFPHRGNILTAVHPFYGPTNSLNLLRQIRSSPDIREPTASEVASFVNKYFDKNETQAEEVKSIIENNYFRGFTGVLAVPEKPGKGLVHFIDYPKFNEKSIVDRDDLFGRINESRAQLPFEHFKSGVVPWRDVAKHPHFIAWADGEEGAEELAELASKHLKKEAYILAPDVSNLKEPIARVAALGNFWFLGGRLSVLDIYRNDVDVGRAFGVFAPAKSLP